ncbi:hypothetical protein [Chondromyces crocatus]|uniref:Uncharacterized protein n=1 Tax=Chondromyces crocatus TaxID=52 RepID=A0A0K1EN00_CHOCO|nr:hypothetical protein [Chondromyces crocatus]AKT42206.1 uncharacterized protein CMC5_064290 [Chondromyces crocatus]
MRPSRRAALVAIVAWALGLSACGAPLPEPEILSSAPQGGYAARFPEGLGETTSRVNVQDETASRTASEMASYPEALKKPDWALVLKIVERAEDTGRSHDYVERARRVEGAAGFFVDNKDDITRKVAGSAQYVAKQKGCEVELSGTVAHALEEAVERELQRELRKRNEAHRLIERHKTGLGKENVAALEKQADDIALASYIVHISMVEDKLRLKRLLEEVEQVQASIDTAIEEERAFEAEPNRTAEEKKASAQRSQELSKAKALLASTAEQARNASERMEERITTARKRHTDAMNKLTADIRQRGGLPAAEQKP